MRKRSTLRTRFAAMLMLSVAAMLGVQAARGSDPPSPSSSELSDEVMDQAIDDVARAQMLVVEGSLPPASLVAAEARLADVHDQATLSETLFSATKLADFTVDQQGRMLAAAQRRLERQAAIVQERQRLLAMGAIAKVEMNSVNAEYETRRHVLDLARDRVRLIEAQRQMTEEEQNLERALESGTSSKAMLKFEGSGDFQLGDLPMIASEFQRQFHYPLPITARGQTTLHQAFGLDHRGKIDVGLNPEEPEGIWLRHLLEDRQIPYIAFRTAVPGAATAPHIHIGSGSAHFGP